MATLDTTVGIICLTLCGRCVAQERLPRLPVTTVMTMATAHCGHLGITLDEMAVAQRST
ncbi:hypothetical protein J2S53_001417 [Actinopolyspora lacussalsi]|nr:hypothetical protein [Actinopolyspora lacussalsi]